MWLSRFRLVPVIVSLSTVLVSCRANDADFGPLDRSHTAVTIDVPRTTNEEVSTLSGRIRTQSAPADARGPQYKGSKGTKTIDEYMTRVVQQVNGFWENQFRTAGASYEPPAVHWFTGSVVSNCGRVTSADGALYCPLRGKATNRLVIYGPVDWMYEEIYAKFGDNADFAVAAVLAHEMGHHVQRMLGVIAQTGEKCCGLLTINTELHADCLSGIWARSAYGQGQLDPGDVDEALRAASDAGDLPGTSPGDPSAHGTPEQRVSFFRLGFESGEGSRCDSAALRGRVT